ncbi:hypothetical protein [Baaleninema simplex]|uniref:hypothetical protein n=1 Tax=Baaleninema simplex TaxID=2862350 RepID=UPI0008FC192A|nr:hypothetical protein [Baaleninema simplex]
MCHDPNATGIEALDRVTIVLRFVGNGYAHTIEVLDKVSRRRVVGTLKQHRQSQIFDGFFVPSRRHARLLTTSNETQC